MPRLVLAGWSGETGAGSRGPDAEAGALPSSAPQSSVVQVGLAGLHLHLHLHINPRLRLR